MEKEIYGYIYCISNIHNDKKYIGQVVAWKGKDRLVEHYRQAHYGYYPVTKFRNVLRKYPLEDFSVETIDCAYSKEELSEKEIYWIAKYDSFHNGYNSSLGGDGGCTGYKHTEKAKKKISENNRKRTISQSMKDKISKANSGRLINNKKTSKPIDMYDGKMNFLKTFPSIREAKRFLDLKDDSVIRGILYKNKSRTFCFGFTFDWHKEENVGQTKNDEELLYMKNQKHIPKNHLVYKVIEKDWTERILIGEKQIKEYAGIGIKCLKINIEKGHGVYKNALWIKQKPYEMPNDYPLVRKIK